MCGLEKGKRIRGESGPRPPKYWGDRPDDDDSVIDADGKWSEDDGQNILETIEDISYREIMEGYPEESEDVFEDSLREAAERSSEFRLRRKR